MLKVGCVKFFDREARSWGVSECLKPYRLLPSSSIATLGVPFSTGDVIGYLQRFVRHYVYIESDKSTASSPWRGDS